MGQGEGREAVTTACVWCGRLASRTL